jgi:hypothetical protein
VEAGGREPIQTIKTTKMCGLLSIFVPWTGCGNGKHGSVPPSVVNP